jgi:MFS family permease
MLRSIGEGFRYVGQDAALRSLILLAAVLNLCTAGPTTIGLAYLAHKRFASPSAYGIWISSLATGMLLGMVIAGLRKSKRRGMLLLSTSFVLGLGIVCLGLLPGLWPVAAVLVAMGGFNGFLSVQLQSWLQQRVDRAMLGRVMSLLMLSVFGLMPFSLAVAGVAVQWSVTWLFAVAGSAVMLVAAAGALQKPVRAIE